MISYQNQSSREASNKIAQHSLEAHAALENLQALIRAAGDLSRAPQTVAEILARVKLTDAVA